MQVMLDHSCGLRAIARKPRRSASPISRELACGGGAVTDPLAAPSHGRPRTACGYRCTKPPSVPQRLASTSPRSAQDAPRQWSVRPGDRCAARGPIAQAGQRHTPAHARRCARQATATSIEERPIGVNERSVPGHWEGDLIRGARNQSQIGPLVERKILFTVLTALDNATVEHTAQRFGFVLNRLDMAAPEHDVRQRARDGAPPSALKGHRNQGVLCSPIQPMGAQHQREHQRLAAPHPTQRHLPERAQPGRSGCHRFAPQRQAVQVSGLEVSCRAVSARRLV